MRENCTSRLSALVQDGTPVPADARLELLGRLPDPESLLLLGRTGHIFNTFGDLRGKSIGIGPEGSGTAYLMRQLFEDPDLRALDVHLSHHGLPEQAQLVAESKLDLASYMGPGNSQKTNTSPGLDPRVASCPSCSGRPQKTP